MPTCPTCAQPITEPVLTHRIQFDRETKDYAIFVRINDGAESCLGYAASYNDAEGVYEQYTFEFLRDWRLGRKGA